jgi:hypothetical protein
MLKIYILSLQWKHVEKNLSLYIQKSIQESIKRMIKKNYYKYI